MFLWLLYNLKAFLFSLSSPPTCVMGTWSVPESCLSSLCPEAIYSVRSVSFPRADHRLHTRSSVSSATAVDSWHSRCSGSADEAEQTQWASCLRALASSSSYSLQYDDEYVFEIIAVDSLWFSLPSGTSNSLQRRVIKLMHQGMESASSFQSCWKNQSLVWSQILMWDLNSWPNARGKNVAKRPALTSSDVGIYSTSLEQSCCCFLCFLRSFSLFLQPSWLPC